MGQSAKVSERRESVNSVGGEGQGHVRDLYDYKHGGVFVVCTAENTAVMLERGPEHASTQAPCLSE